MLYLKHAKNWALHAGVNCLDVDLPPEDCMTAAQVAALISIAESLKSFNAVKEVQGAGSIIVKLSALKEMSGLVAILEFLSVWSECNWENYSSRISSLKSIHRLANQLADLLVELTNELDPLGLGRSNQCE